MSSFVGTPTDDHEPPPLDGDLELAERMLAGDREAFDAFFDGHFPSLYRMTLARVRDPDLARDIVQTAICRAIANLGRFRGDASLAAWLFTICRNETSAHFRKLRRVPPPVELVEEAADVRQALDARRAGEPDPEKTVADREVATLVHDTLDHLPPRYGRALEWKYLEGLSVKEIAGRLRVGPKAAESLLTRARNAFREGFPAFGRPGTRRSPAVKTTEAST